MNARCDNCGNVFPYTSKDLTAIPDLLQRIEPGSEVPAAECPECGALAYPQTEAAASADWRRLAQDLYAVLEEILDRPDMDAILCAPTFRKAHAVLHQAAALLDVSPADCLSEKLPIVIPASDAPPEVRAPFQVLAPDSVAVAIQRDPAGPVMVYYEGGLYTRGASRPATPDERRQYAISAAGQAIEHSPTIAFFVLPSWTGLEVVGRVDTKTWRVWWTADPVAH